MTCSRTFLCFDSLGRRHQLDSGDSTTLLGRGGAAREGGHACQTNPSKILESRATQGGLSEPHLRASLRFPIPTLSYQDTRGIDAGCVSLPADLGVIHTRYTHPTVSTAP